MNNNPTPQQVYRTLLTHIGQVIRGQESAMRKLFAALLTGGHVLLEDYPGTGKTTLAKALAQSINTRFRRIQFTPDLLPSDILGVSIYNQRDQTFHFQEGPVFTNILLADEINRASPRTQSALLEAMAEGQVTVEGERRALPALFFAMATENPVEFRGTYPLPEAQMDRFAMRFNLGYVSEEQEVAILTAQERSHPIDSLGACISEEELLMARRAVTEVKVSPELKHYIVKLVSTTRGMTGVQLGASPRASISLMKAAQAIASFDGGSFVTPDHVQELAVCVISHRLVLEQQAKFSGVTAESIVREILKKTPVPA